MDFQKAIDAVTIKDRDNLINEEIEENFFDLTDCIAANGCDGWPEVKYCGKITIQEDKEKKLLLVRVFVQGNETVPSGCKDAPLTYSFSATIIIQLCSEDGIVISEEATEYKSDRGSWDDNEDFYPGDYN